MLFDGKVDSLANIWIYLFAPMGGAIVAVFFFSKVYQKTQEIVEEVEDLEK